MTNVVLTITTKVQSFPAAVVAGRYSFFLQGQPEQVTDALSATFADVAPGVYSAYAVRLDSAGNQLGDAVSGSVTVPTPDINVDVPDTLTVALA
jgi:hypothetical protein